MTEQKSKWIPGLAIAACAACCMLPLAGFFLVGGSSIALATFLSSEQMKEILVCGIPLLLIITACFIYGRRKKSEPCCEAQGAGCNSSRCDVDTKNN